MIFRNAVAERDGTNPREELEKFVLSNRAHINQSRVYREIGHELKSCDEDAWLTELVRTQDPYTVLEACFAQGRLYVLAANRRWASLDSEYEKRELVGEILEALGFRKEVKPSGLTQIREKIDPRLELAEVDSQRFAAGENLDFAAGMGTVMEELLDKLFRFHSEMLRQHAELTTADIDKLCEQYERTPQRTLGLYVRLQNNEEKGDNRGFLAKLMKFAQEDAALIAYCERYFQRIVPLDESEIAAVGMFTIYRNLIVHIWDWTQYPRTLNKAQTNLLSMDEATRGEWEGSWQQVTEAVDRAKRNRGAEPALPKREMLQRMVVFFRGFLKSLSQGIYPKVIVMQSHVVDNYGTRQITAADDAGETVFLTDCEFEPFTEFYYLAHTNLVGIEPILVRKDELENWGIQQDSMNASHKEA